MSTELYIQKLDIVNREIAKLIIEQEQLKKKILENTKAVRFNESGEVISIAKEGQHTHTCGMYEVTIKTDYIYTIDTERYAMIARQLPEEFDPVATKQTFAINKALYRKLEKTAPSDIKLLLSNVVSKKFAKPYLTYKFAA